MITPLYCLVVLIGGCVLFLFILLFMYQPSRQAQRMLSLVKSTRADFRELSLREQTANMILRGIHNLRKKLGMVQDVRLSRRFMEAGWRNTHAGDVFFAVQLIGLLVGGTLGTVIPGKTVLSVIVGGSLGFTTPLIWLARKQKSRRERIRRSLPDMLDLLVVCVGAGLGLDQALLRVGEELSLSHPQITHELERVSLERQAGSPRLDAWRSLAERVRIKELTAFTDMLTETDRFGTPIVKALSEFSDELRVQRRQRAEEAAAKTKIKIIFPLVLCIFPCVFIVLLAPALLGMAKSFSSMSR